MSRPTGAFGVFYGNPHFDGLRSAFYHRGAEGPTIFPRPALILVATGRTRTIPPVRALHEVYQMFAALGEQAQTGARKPFTVMHAVTPGPLGGQASCWAVLGPQTTPAPAGSMCAWADTDTFGVMLMPGLRGDRAATTLLRFRSAIEKPPSGR